MPDHCEVKLHAFRKTQDGVVVSFVVHPSEVPNCLALDPLGTRYMLALAEIADDETQNSEPCPFCPRIDRHTHAIEDPAPLPEHSEQDVEIREDILSATKPARGVTPKDPVRSQAARQQYAQMDEGEQAVVRAALYTKDPVFWQWSDTQNGDEANEFILMRCGIGKKRDLASSPVALGHFLDMEDAFFRATGRRAEAR